MGAAPAGASFRPYTHAPRSVRAGSTPACLKARLTPRGMASSRSLEVGVESPSVHLAFRIPKGEGVAVGRG